MAVKGREYSEACVKGSRVRDGGWQSGVCTVRKAGYKGGRENVKSYCGFFNI